MTPPCPKHFTFYLLLFLFPLTSLLRGEEQNNPAKIVVLLGEHEYDTAETLPRFLEGLPKQIQSTIIHAASNDRSSADCHRFPGLAQALPDADLLLLSVRRRFPPTADLDAIKTHLRAGKPILAIRTSSHAFQARSKGVGYTVPAGHAQWADFDQEILGIDYQGHYGSTSGGATLRPMPDQKASPILADIEWPAMPETYRTPHHLYKSLHLADDATLLISGHLPEHPHTFQPIAWTRTQHALGRGRVFATSLGGTEDFVSPESSQLLEQAIHWALTPLPTPSPEAPPLPPTRKQQATGKPQPAYRSARAMIHPKDLRSELLLAEPGIAQPNFFTFDERGRLWIVQFRQYPEPAGLEALSRDKYWRTVYDKVPPPPGHPEFVPGRDRISIHQDTTGDGRFDHSEIFLDGLNLASGLAFDHHKHAGTWVLQPPYLLFYPDIIEDKSPKPEIHLRGFGLQDTHSIATALTWGPDGWLYGCQGSTVTSDVTVEGREGTPSIRSVGQNIWRYHPRERRYEIFAEGGGNIWSCEFDAVGRLYAGTNNSNPAFHYIQGAYYIKGFKKHGALSNPHSYGYLLGIEHPGWKRVSCNVFVYQEGALPERYDNALIAANPIQGWLSASRLTPHGIGMRGQAIDFPADSTDRWFRPVVADAGPDGAIYLGDWYDSQVNHYKHHEGILSPSDGRLYRIAAKDAPALPPFDLSDATAHQLVDLLHARAKWWRETAQRLLADHPQRAEVAPRLRALLDEPGHIALEALWALHRTHAPESPELSNDLARALKHPNPHVRRWAFRLIGDRPNIRDPFLQKHAKALAEAIAHETEIDVLAQAAATAKRMPAATAIPMIRALLDHSLQHKNLDLVIWWAAEAQVGKHHATTKRLSEVLAGSRLAPQLVRRLAISDPQLLPPLFAAAKNPNVANASKSSKALLDALQKATSGPDASDLPPELLTTLGGIADVPLSLRFQLGDPKALPLARAHLAHLPNAKKQKNDEETRRIIRIFGERPDPDIQPALEALLQHPAEELRIAAMNALSPYPEATLDTLFTSQDRSAPEESARVALLTSRPAWALAWLESGATIPTGAKMKMRQLDDPAINARLPKPVASSKAAEHRRLSTLLTQPGGDVYKGMVHYQTRCGACHRLFDRGGAIGPDLTAYQRNDLDSLLTAILDPSAEIREGYEQLTITTTDGRVLSGFLTRETETATTLRTLGGTDITIPAETIRTRKASETSLMPPGLLAGLDDEALQDLFSYLQTLQPLNQK